MKNRYLLSIFTILLLSACGGEKANNGEIAESDTLIYIPVEAGRAEQGSVSAYYSTTATLEAEEEAEVVAKTNGIITRLFVEEGDFVRVGTPLLQLDDTQYKLEVNRAEANLNRLQSDFDRNKEMFERNMVSAEVFDRVKYEYESQKATLDMAKLNVEYTTVRAPISGVVSERMVRTGNMVVPNQNVFRVTTMNPLKAILHLPEHELQKIKVGQKVMMDIDAIPNTTFEGSVERISPVVDRSTGTFRVVVLLRDQANRIKPGMFARVRVVYDVRDQTMVVPKLAIINDGGRNSVFVVNDSLVKRKNVTVGYTNGTKVEILNGLDIGDVVVTVGHNSLRDSTRVEIINIL
ncbi:MAG TPA: efflux transporter periplasmic adaptor subunit [Bacteroidetes bacterium]|nr:efflux transporter periplasmic adaptor subunit [Bacteroidota bacterium]